MMDNDTIFDFLETNDGTGNEVSDNFITEIGVESTQDNESEETSTTADDAGEESVQEKDTSTQDTAETSDNENVSDAEKRRKDSERWAQQEHQKRLELEKELAEYKKLQIEAARNSDDEAFKRRMEDDPTAAILELKRKKDELESSMETKIQQAIAQDRFARAEAAFAEQNPDYYDLIQPFEKDFLQGSLRERWQSAGATPEAAYKIAKAEQAVQLMRSNPEEYEERLIQKAMERLRNQSGEQPKSTKESLADVNSMTPKQHIGEDPYAHDDFGNFEFLNRKTDQRLYSF